MLDDRPAVPSAGRRRGPALLRAPPARAAALALGALVLALVLARTTSLVDRLDALIFDTQVRLVRLARAPAPPDATGIVIVGLDEASLDELHVPMAMMHASLGRTLEVIAAARPRIIGLDMALPERSLDPLVPGLDLALMRGLVAARSAGGVVVAADVDAQGRLRLPYLPLLAAAGGPSALGLPLFVLDADGVVRRFEPAPGRGPVRGAAPAPPGDAQAALPTFAARIAQRLGRAPELERPGWLDFTRGAPFAYLPLRTVLAWDRAGDAARLRAQFDGKVVLLGSVLPFLDRLPLPVPLGAWEPGQRAPPGVVVNAQLLRSALGAGLVRPLPAPIEAALALGLVAGAVGAGAGGRLRRGAVVLLVAVAAGAVAHGAGIFVPPATALLAGSMALAALGAIDLAGARAGRARLARQLQQFSGYVSPRLLQALIDGRVDPAGTRRSIALLFADLRDFTAWSETADPGAVRDLLNRYYARITPLLHAHGGTIDNFRGDGVMVMFGAPEPLAQACDAAFAAARAMVAAVAQMPARLPAHDAAHGSAHASAPAAPQADPGGAGGRPGLALSIGLAYGEVVFGDVGSAERRDFTALGDAVNVAARLQELAKPLGYPVVMTQAFSARLAAPVPGIEALGTQALKGHTPVPVCGWRAPPPPG